jgi:phosphopentomutase
MRGRMRAAVIVLDACGIGALPDAAAYGDAGADTLGHLADAVGGLDLPVLTGLGLGSIAPLRGAPPAPRPALHGRLHPLGPGKDSATGHWELMGAVTPVPLPTYPEGFPPDVVADLERATGRRFCCNAPYNGIAVLEDFGPRHLETGELILYTSVDSVLQVAAHSDVLSAGDLVATCRAIREVMTGERAVGRVIARPFTGAPGGFMRTDGRKDLSVPPPGPTYLDALAARDVPVHGVGKIHDLFAGHGIAESHPGATNDVALEATTQLLRELDRGLVFTNLVDTDQVHGHRKDVEGFHQALRRIDAAVATWLSLLGPEDLLVLTADHGCDPTMPHSDHTREHAPVLAAFPGHDGRRHDGPLADVGASVLRWLAGEREPELPGTPFVP